MDIRSPTVNILIVYYSRFGVVRRLAELLAEGARRARGLHAGRLVTAVDVRFMEVEDQPIVEPRPGESLDDVARRRTTVVNELAWADALIVGAPSYYGSMASPVKRLFEDALTASPVPELERTRPWLQWRFHNKVGAAFTASATPHGGNEQTLHSILTLLMHLGMIIITPGQTGRILESPVAPYGVTAVSGPMGDRMPDEADEELARQLGQRVAEMTLWLRWGQREWERFVLPEVERTRETG